ncbi:Tetratricopeptide repeat protein 27 isoform E [Glycine soja]|uniref:Tetratricopeptide repeat protein 27 isoform D n=1 Tax=Glycine soja TaxID=3848 RepID=A0A445KAH2_GLYSO|nr:Tetratricopeptide repeat protein 27 isoform D [Glycine soja]RZC07808.1 Tetratricopeptide repeat protein 27 isoform E [Glycine soja]
MIFGKTDETAGNYGRTTAMLLLTLAISVRSYKVGWVVKGEGREGKALEGVQMILNMSNNKRVDCELLERITKEVEKRLSTSNVPPLITDNKPKTDQFCIVDPGSENQEQVSGASVTGRSRETEQLLLLLGKVLQQIIKTGSGCGPEIWGLYAKWHRINGDLMMCSEALLKQVRSLQGSDTWKDRDRFKKFAKVSLELCQVLRASPIQKSSGIFRLAMMK